MLDTMSRALNTATLRELAVKANVDPRTVVKVYRGETVRGGAGDRARKVLVAEGLLKGDGKAGEP